MNRSIQAVPFGASASFATFGKKNGLGLGLALSRQTLLDHGGDLWVNGEGPGAEFQMPPAEGAP